MGIFSVFDYSIEKMTDMRDYLMLQRIKYNIKKNAERTDGTRQYTDVYWEDGYIQTILNWGEKTVWNEIQYLLAMAEGRVLDIACGLGPVMTLLQSNNRLDVYGCDISDRLVKMAIDEGIPANRIKVGDATNLDYEDDFFNYSYSIGSLEHFTLKGIDQFIESCHRVTKIASFHQMPTSKRPDCEGWLNLMQSFHNQPIEWWREKFLKRFSRVRTLNSAWHDQISNGTWFICEK